MVPDFFRRRRRRRTGHTLQPDSEHSFISFDDGSTALLAFGLIKLLTVHASLYNTTASTDHAFQILFTPSVKPTSFVSNSYQPQPTRTRVM